MRHFLIALALVIGIGRANAQDVGGNISLGQAHAICMKHNALSFSPLYMPAPGWEMCKDVLSQWQKSHPEMSMRALSPQERSDMDSVRRYVQSLKKSN